MPKPVSEPALPSFAIAGVHKGEGVEHSLIRQLVSDPSLADHTKLGTKLAYNGNLSDAQSVKRWAGRVAHVIATNGGFFEWKFGEDIHVNMPDAIAPVLQKDKDGNLTVAIYTAAALAAATAAKAQNPSPQTQANANNNNGSGSTSVQPIAIVLVAPTLASSHFLGKGDGSTILPPPFNQYFRMYTGSE